MFIRLRMPINIYMTRETSSYTPYSIEYGVNYRISHIAKYHNMKFLVIRKHIRLSDDGDICDDENECICIDDDIDVC